MTQSLDAISDNAPANLVATDACRRLSHRLARGPSSSSAQGETDACITCTEEWGRLNGLKDWQENCPCCFSEAHPNGLADVDITAEIRVAAETIARLR
jgi:hypothetical protein